MKGLGFTDKVKGLRIRVKGLGFRVGLGMEIQGFRV